ncbi:MAG: hypothetical protein ACOYYU_02975 [Chloroflexota bacterium]
MSNNPIISLLQRISSDSEFQRSYLQSPEDVMKSVGITDPDDMSTLKPLLSPFTELGILQFGEVQEHYQVMSSLRSGLQSTIKQMLDGYARTMLMYSISFYIGIGLLVLAAVFAIQGREPLLPLVFAGLGTADIIGYFVVGPPLQIQESRSDLAQLQATYFAWYQNMRYVDSFIQTEYQKYINRQISSTDYSEILRATSKSIIEDTRKVLTMIESFVERKQRKGTLNNSGLAERGESGAKEGK